MADSAMAAPPKIELERTVVAISSVDAGQRAAYVQRVAGQETADPRPEQEQAALRRT